MIRDKKQLDLGEPDLKVAGFQLWVHGREFPLSEDYYDGNWLRVTAHCGASGASVWTDGAIVMAQDISRFGRECADLLASHSGSATLDPIEPELKISLVATDGRGNVRAQIEITPDHLAQHHSFQLEIDQSYLSGIVSQCAAILRQYPVRGEPNPTGA